jgi:hypothetical protein
MKLHLWFLYLLFFPFQLFAPGSLQISDFLILFGIIFSLKEIYYEIRHNNFFIFLFLFCVYSFLLSIVISILNSDFIFLKAPFNYFYCLLFIIFIKHISNKSKFLAFTLSGIFFSLVVQVFVFKNTEINLEYTRYILKFNNPNQLGFWGLNIFVILILFYYNIILSSFWKIITIISIFLSIFFILISISQAAIISLLLFLLYFSFLYLRKKIITFIFILTTLIFLVLFNLELVNEIPVIQNTISRIDNETNNDDGDNDLEGRNYTRLYNYPQYLVFGSSEGLNDRFGTKDLNEIHSTFANLIFSYGLIGFLFFIIPYLFIIKTQNWFNIITLFIFLIFTLAHNTLRWPLFWLVPLFILIINNKYYNNVRYKRNCFSIT